MKDNRIELEKRLLELGERIPLVKTLLGQFDSFDDMPDSYIKRDIYSQCGVIQVIPLYPIFDEFEKE